MAFDFVILANASTLAGVVTGTGREYPGHYLHGLFINQADSVGTTLTTTVQVWAQEPGGSGTYVKVVQQADVNTDEWFTAIGSGAGDYQKYLSFGDVNSTGVHSAGKPLLIPYVAGGKFRIVVTPTNGTADDTFLAVGLLSDGLT